MQLYISRADFVNKVIASISAQNDIINFILVFIMSFFPPDIKPNCIPNRRWL